MKLIAVSVLSWIGGLGAYLAVLKYRARSSRLRRAFSSACLPHSDCSLVQESLSPMDDARPNIGIAPTRAEG